MKALPVVTGAGAVTPLGKTAPASWNALIAGHSAIRSDDGFLSARPCGFSGAARSRGMLSSAVAEAVESAGLSRDAAVGFFLCQSKPGAAIASGDFFGNICGNAVAAVAAEFPFRKKFVKNIVAACAGAVPAVLSAAVSLECGFCDAAIVGAAEASIEPLYVGAFLRMGVLARRRVSPFDVEREGFALAEGAAAVVLEKKDRALARRAEILAEIDGICSSSSPDAVNIGRSAAAISAMMKSAAGFRADEIDYVNAHGTATRENDAAEAEALARTFGARATDQEMSISSTKAATGHLLGASALAEFVFTVYSVIFGIVPPTLNLQNPITGLDFTPCRAREKKIRRAMTVSYGFGGQTGAIVCRRTNA